MDPIIVEITTSPAYFGDDKTLRLACEAPVTAIFAEPVPLNIHYQKAPDAPYGIQINIKTAGDQATATALEEAVVGIIPRQKVKVTFEGQAELIGSVERITAATATARHQLRQRTRGFGSGTPASSPDSSSIPEAFDGGLTTKDLFPFG